MQNSFDTSFIPQQPLLRVEGVQRRHEPVNFALILSFVVFFVTLIVAGGVFFYDRKIDAQILAKQIELEELEKSLDSAKIEEYKRIDARFRVARALLHEHAVFSTVLDFLEQYTAKDIGFSDLNYQVNDKKEIELRLTGVGPSYQSVYFQQRVWQRNITEKDSLISGVEIPKAEANKITGIITFDASIVLRPVPLKYINYLDAVPYSATSTVDINSIAP